MEKLDYKKVIFLLLISISASVFLFLAKKDYGTSYNTVRIEKGVPTVGLDWFKEGIVWKAPRTETRLNYHEFKEVHKSTFKVLRELDRFVVEEGKSRLIMSYSYELEDEGKYPWLIHYCKGYSSEGFGDCESHSEISLKEAKKILDSYEEISYSPKVVRP